MKNITQLDQVNMLIKHANRNSIKIDSFIVTNATGNLVFAKIGNAIKKRFFTVYNFIEKANKLFDFVP